GFVTEHTSSSLVTMRAGTFIASKSTLCKSPSALGPVREEVRTMPSGGGLTFVAATAAEMVPWLVPTAHNGRIGVRPRRSLVTAARSCTYLSSSSLLGSQ